MLIRQARPLPEPYEVTKQSKFFISAIIRGTR